MSEQIEFCLNRASVAEIAAHLLRCNECFVPPLSGRVEIGGYAHKVASRATRFEAWDGALIGLVAIYCNEAEGRTAYITSVSVLPGWQGRGIASHLLEQCIAQTRAQGFEGIELEVDGENFGATKLYEKRGFTTVRMNGQVAIMRLSIGREA